jgi:5'(3')-deoxyribonucleotidase
MCAVMFICTHAACASQLVRLVRVSKIYERWQARISFSFATVMVIKCVTAILLSAHWFACTIALQTTLHTFARETWLVRFGYCMEAESDPTMTVDQCMTVGGVRADAWYLACFSWSMLVITGNGVGGSYPTPFSTAETMVVTIIQFLSAMMWAVIIASFCDLTTNANPAGLQFRQTMDDLNLFMEDNDIPDPMRVRLRRYFHHIRNLQIMNAAAEVVGKLSSTLQVEVVMHVHGSWIKNVSFLKQVEQGAVVQVARAMQAIVFSPNELPPPRTLYVIKSGIILRKSLLASGSTFGEDVCVNGPPDEHCIPTRCMTYAEVLALAQPRLFRIVANFEKAQKAVRRVEVVYTIYRGIIRVVKQAAKIAGKQRKGQSPNDFVHALVDASTNEARQAMVEAGGLSFFVKSSEEETMDTQDQRFRALEKEVAGLRSEMRGTNETLRELIEEIRKPRIEDAAGSTATPEPPPVTVHAPLQRSATAHAMSSGRRANATPGDPGSRTRERLAF